MIDDQTRLLLGAYHDGELSTGEALAMERRLAAEPELRAAYERLGALSQTLRAIPPWTMPPTLPARVAQALASTVRIARPRGGPGWQAMAATLLAGLAVGGLIGAGGMYLGRPSGPEATLDAIVAGHLRALAAPEPFDIASSNRHVVKPWFNGRTTLAPDAPDLTPQGFPLTGGRIDIVDGRTVPTLVYHRDRHVISVTIVPRTKNAEAGEDHVGGSTVEHWSVGDLTYWVTSDLNQADLRSFVQLFRTQTSPVQ